MALEIRFSRADKTYVADGRCSGVIVVKTPSKLAHAGIQLTATGRVEPQMSLRAAGLFSSGILDPIQLLLAEIPVDDAGTVPEGEVEIPFEFKIEPVDGEKLVETYHGVYVNIRYAVRVELKRTGMFARSLVAEEEFIVHCPSPRRLEAEPKDFEILPTSLKNVISDKVSAIPPFRVTGRLEQTNASLTEPFMGHITVEESEERIRSLELQLVRVEVVRRDDKTAVERTEIQNLQIGDGDVPRGVAIPLYMILPRLFTCPSTRSSLFSVDFEVNVFVRFERHYQSTLNIPIALFREPVKA